MEEPNGCDCTTPRANIHVTAYKRTTITSRVVSEVSIMGFQIGDEVRIEAIVCKDHTYLDPTGLTLTVTAPDGTDTVYTYVEDSGSITWESTGHYSFAFEPQVGGRWSYAWASSGTSMVAASSGFFDVEEQLVSLTVHTEEDDNDPIANAQVIVTASDGSLLGVSTTGATGDAVVRVRDHATCNVRVMKAGWEFEDATVLMSGDTTVPLIGESLETALPVTVQMCRVYGYYVDASGFNVSDAEIILNVTGARSWTNASGQSSGVDPENVGVRRERRIIYPLHGYWEVDLVVGATVQVMIPDLKFSTTFRVPSQAKLNIKDARPYPGSANEGPTPSAPAVY